MRAYCTARAVGHVELSDEDEHHMALQQRRFGCRDGAGLELLLLLDVLAMQPDQPEVHGWSDDGDDPCTLEELGDQQDPDHREGEHARESVDDRTELPALPSQGQVMFEHPEAGEREACEDTDRVEPYERIEIAP